MVSDAAFPSIFNSWIFGDDPTVTYNRDFDLVGNEYWFPLSSDAVDVLYLVVTLHAWTYWRAGNGNDYYCVGGGGVGFVGGTKIIARVDTGTRADTGVRQSHGSTQGSTPTQLIIEFVFMPINNVVLDIFPYSV